MAFPPVAMHHWMARAGACVGTGLGAAWPAAPVTAAISKAVPPGAPGLAYSPAFCPWASWRVGAGVAWVAAAAVLVVWVWGEAAGA
ncbi:hypothetical protein [Acidovorax sp. SDU_ACID1]|uniref:hypothetical protein n=1 Tax=Acidovorax sp. SDU_ACID1 TaxID=3136632 RepID=UPI0038739320